jgi:hypothetical protein
MVSPFYSYLKDKIPILQKNSATSVSYLEMVAFIQEQWNQEPDQVVSKYVNEF